MRKSFFLLYLPVIVYVILIVLAFFFSKETGMITEWLNALVAIGGLLVAILTTFINYGARLDAQRQTVYEKQLEAYNEIFSIALKVTEELSNITKYTASNDKLKRAKKVAKEYYKITRKYWLWFPNEVINAIRNFESNLYLYEGILTSDPPNRECLIEISVNSSISLRLLTDVFRTSLGVEKLHEDTLRLMGEKPGHKP